MVDNKKELEANKYCCINYCRLTRLVKLSRRRRKKNNALQVSF